MKGKDHKIWPLPEIVIKMHYYIGVNSPIDSSYPGLLDVVYWVVEGRILSGKKINFRYYYDDYYIDDDRVIE